MLIVAHFSSSLVERFTHTGKQVRFRLLKTQAHEAMNVQRSNFGVDSWLIAVHVRSSLKEGVRVGDSVNFTEVHKPLTATVSE